jgi:hypothetical protein
MNKGFEVLISVVKGSQQTFRRNILPPSSGSKKSKQETSVKEVASVVFNGLCDVASDKIDMFSTVGVTLCTPKHCVSEMCPGVCVVVFTGTRF